MKEITYNNYISTHFNNIHPNAEKEFDIYHRYFRKNYLVHLPKDKHAKIADIGCGMGHFLYFLEKEGYKNYIGIDISEENINFCRNHNFNVKLYDVFNFLTDNTEPFQAIIANDIIEHFNKEEIVKLFDLIKNNLSEDGIFIVKVPNASNPITGSSSRYCDFTHEVNFTEESLSQILKVCGYKTVNIYPQDIYVIYSNPLNYIAKLIAWLSFLLFRLLFILYGRKTTKIFTKDLIAVARK
ncbi:class I SAM-dependent methyltransferase [Methanocella conradii]|uniref:class I SAM-dependent methyltransferase n=1 Tax=Methanocella conradii TaxID=1175444 RepID=UPI00157C1296|nr:class I SAM-dependent methyltransferase [Methanocella conradii]